jgi:hypothetical protein
MSIYPPPREHNGSLNTIFNSTDYKNTNNEGGLSISKADSRYLRNNGIVVSSAETTFNNTVNLSQLNVSNLATIQDLNIENLFTAKKSSDTLTTAIFTSNQEYDLNNGMVYYIPSDNTTVDSFSIINIPDVATDQSYIFSFIFKPSQADSPYYIKKSSIFVNEVSIPLFGLQNVSLPTNYTYLIQQISIINGGNDFFAITSVSAY